MKRKKEEEEQFRNKKEGDDQDDREVMKGRKGGYSMLAMRWMWSCPLSKWGKPQNSTDNNNKRTIRFSNPFDLSDL